MWDTTVYPQPQGAASKPDSSFLGDSRFTRLLPHDLQRGQAVVFQGPRDTFKTTFAVTFLAHGVLHSESGLLLRLSDRPLLASNSDLPTAGRPIERQLSRQLRGDYETANQCPDNSDRFSWDQLDGVGEDVKSWRALALRSKANVNVWKKKDPKAPVWLIEANFLSGMILPEEFVAIVRAILEKAIRESNAGGDTSAGNAGIRRVVLDDVSSIALRYPLLHESSTAGKLFLPMMAKTLQGYGVDLVITATETGLKDADEVVHRAAALAHGVIKTRFCDVFGQRYVTVESDIQGARQVGGDGATSSDNSGKSKTSWTVHPVPVVVQYHPDYFDLKPELLEGLVGFGTGNIRRPGLRLYLFSEYGTADSIQARYNRTLQTLIRSALGRAVATVDARENESDVSVVSFDSRESAAVHDSISVLGQRPVDRTVIYSVDEFWSTDEDRKSSGAQHELLTNVSAPQHRELKKPEKYIVDWSNSIRNQTIPYYANVLLLAFRQDVLLQCREEHIFSSWGRDLATSILKSDWTGIATAPAELGPPSWEDVYRLARGLHRTGDHRVGIQSPIKRAFCFDRSADETVACALMDALIAGMPESDTATVRQRVVSAIAERKLEDWRSERSAFYVKFGENLRDQFDERQYQQVLWLAKSLHLANEWAPSDGRLAPDAGVYLCWYSQLRDLIERNPALAERLQVAALPGGGFTGDWFVGISQGSVSTSMGETILKVICSKTEEYKRFSMGVGLPVSLRLYGELSQDRNRDPEFYAWPNSRHVPLVRLLALHGQAASRAKLRGYTGFRSILATIGKQLAPKLEACTTEKDRETCVKENVGRLPAQVRLFAPPE